MYLMEGREQLDAHVFNGRQKIVKPIVTNIVVPWNFEIFFSLLYTYLELKSLYCSTNFCPKKYSQFDRKKEMEAMKE